MPSTKATKLWLVNWLLLPKGYQKGGGFLVSLRHFLRDVHEWAAVLFIVAIVVHLVLHRTYISSNLKKYNIIK